MLNKIKNLRVRDIKIGVPASDRDHRDWNPGLKCRGTAAARPGDRGPGRSGCQWQSTLDSDSDSPRQSRTASHCHGEWPGTGWQLRSEPENSRLLALSTSVWTRTQTADRASDPPQLAARAQAGGPDRPGLSGPDV